MVTGFTQKEMLIRLMDKMDTFETKVCKKLDTQAVQINSTHELASVTNGKVRLHTKMIWGLCGVLLTIIGWMVVIK